METFLSTDGDHLLGKDFALYTLEALHMKHFLLIFLLHLLLLLQVFRAFFHACCDDTNEEIEQNKRAHRLEERALRLLDELTPSHRRLYVGIRMREPLPPRLPGPVRRDATAAPLTMRALLAGRL